MKLPIICLMGPTAAGKTAVAIELTQQLPCDIISVDSGMIYRGMDIGTAKPTREELAIAPHRLIDICDPAESYSAGQFRRDAIHEIGKIHAAKRIPLLVGGTMLYFRVLQQGISELPRAHPEIRQKITAQAKEFGWEFLHQKLQQVDPEAAQRISSADGQRIQRALELFELTGKTLSELHRQEKAEPLPFAVLNIAIAPNDREYLNQRIITRFQKMLDLGFIDEVKKLFTRGDLHPDLPSMRTVGYRQAWQYLDGKISWENFLELVPIATRQLAKRQLTWLRSWNAINWFATEERELTLNIKQKIAAFLATKNATY